MKVYLVWGYYNYYPTGPGDLRGVFSSHEAAQNLADELEHSHNFDHVEVTEEQVDV